jgi:tetratricopeptide (TPR) repeat protein
MTRRRRRSNPFRVAVLTLLVAAAIYINQMVVPNIPPPFVPTPTPTRAPESYLTEAQQYFSEGKLLQAIEAYQQVIRLQPDNPATYVALARVQVFAGQYEEALQNAESALLLNQNYALAHAVRGWALDFLGNYLEAEAAVKRALEIDPNNALAHAYYAEILVDQYLNNVGGLNTIELAAEESRVALSLSSALETHRARGYVLEVTSNYEEAIAEYQAALEFNSNLADLYLALGRNYSALGINDKAVEAFTRAIALNPSDPIPNIYISRVYGRIGEYAKAAQYAEQAVKADPTNGSYYGNWGVWLYRNFQWPEAAEKLGLAINGGLTEDGQPITPVELSNDLRVAEYYFTYALVLARLGRCGDALPVAQQILTALPADEIATFNANEAIRICNESLSGTPAP